MTCAPEYDAAQRSIHGCDVCRAWHPPAHHDWTLTCRVCDKVFVRSSCSCDGCCGGTYAGQGGGMRCYEV